MYFGRSTDEYDNCTDQYGCNPYGAHNCRCPRWTPPAPPVDEKAEGESLVECMGCGETVKFKLVRDTGVCPKCQATCGVI